MTAVLTGVGVFRIVMWTLCLAWFALVGSSYFSGESHTESAIQQAAGAGMACAGLIGGYVTCRAIDFILQQIVGRRQ